MNIYLHEFRTSVRSVIIWSAALTLLLLAFLSIFSSLAPDAALLNEAMAKMPKEMLIAFGLNGVDLSSVMGSFSFVFVFCQLCLAIQAANYGVSLVSVEERDMTADFLLAKPVGRTRILTSKLLAALTSLTITNLVVWIASVILVPAFSNGRTYAPQALVLLLLSIVLFQLFFLAVGVLVSLIMKRVRSVTAVSMALAFGTYALNAFGGLLGKNTFDLLSPFKYFDPNYIITNLAYDTPLVLLSLVIIVVAVVGSYALYTRRDIQTAV